MTVSPNGCNAGESSPSLPLQISDSRVILTRPSQFCPPKSLVKCSSFNCRSLPLSRSSPLRGMFSSPNFGCSRPRLAKSSFWQLGGYSLDWVCESQRALPSLLSSSLPSLDTYVSLRVPFRRLFTVTLMRFYSCHHTHSSLVHLHHFPFFPLHFRSRSCACCRPRAPRAPLAAARSSSHLGHASMRASRHQSCTLYLQQSVKAQAHHCSK